MTHGGAREGAGRKAKFHDWNGNPLSTKRVWIPTILNDGDIQKAALIKLRALQETDEKENRQGTDAD